MPTHPDSAIRPDSQVVYAELDQEAILLNVATGMYFGLDAVGAEIWRAIYRGQTEEEILRQLRANYDGVDDLQLERDLYEFLAVLASHGLIHTHR
jgi:hypothetical protein